MKKQHLFRSILSALVILSMLAGIPVLAEEPVSEEPIPDENGLYVLTEEVPDDVNNYTDSIVAGMMDMQLAGTADSVSNYSIGTPFVLKNANGITQYVYPIIKNNEIRFFLRVCKNINPNEEYAGYLSDELADEFNLMMSTPSAPISILQYNESLIAVQDSSIDVLLGEPVTEADLSAAPQTFSDQATVVNLLSGSPIALSRASTATSKYLSTDIIETQPFNGSTTGNNWCGGYAAAFCARFASKQYYGSSYTRYDVYDVKDYCSEVTQLYHYFPVTALQSWGLYEGMDCSWVSDVVDGTYIKSDLMGEIDANRPVWLGYTDAETYAQHAVAARGYNQTGYSIWNPVSSSYETIKSLGTPQLTWLGHHWNLTDYIKGWGY